MALTATLWMGSVTPHVSDAREIADAATGVTVALGPTEESAQS